jgi:hypothetical protein
MPPMTKINEWPLAYACGRTGSKLQRISSSTSNSSFLIASNLLGMYVHGSDAGHSRTSLVAVPITVRINLCSEQRIVHRSSLPDRDRALHKPVQTQPVKIERQSSSPLNDVAISRQKVSRGWQNLAQLKVEVAKIQLCLRFGGIGPEEEGQLLAGLRYILVQDETGVE